MAPPVRTDGPYRHPLLSGPHERLAGRLIADAGRLIEVPAALDEAALRRRFASLPNAEAEFLVGLVCFEGPLDFFLVMSRLKLLPPQLRLRLARSLADHARRPAEQGTAAIAADSIVKAAQAVHDCPVEGDLIFRAIAEGPQAVARAFAVLPICPAGEVAVAGRLGLLRPPGRSVPRR